MVCEVEDYQNSPYYKVMYYKYLQQRKHATETILSFAQQIRSIPDSMAGQMRAREVDIVHSALQLLNGHEPHPAGTRFVTRDTLCMCVCLTSITMVTMLSLTPSVIHKRGGPVGC